MDTDDKTYELPDRRARNVPGDGERPRPEESEDPERLPEKRQAPAHKGLPKGQRTQIWDEASQRYMESVAPDRKHATEDDYHAPDGGPVTRGDQGPG